MEDKGLPTVGDVITKLKSDGTFDNFRKSCVNSIENEPLFRAQKEEVEVISRKFLQRGHWDDKTLKSDVRAHLKNYVLDVLHRPEAINQLGFIAEKILSRKHKEFMTQINEVTQSLQDTATSNYRDENISSGGTREEPVKAKETAVDLLQSFAISTPSTTTKRPPAKAVKQAKLVNQDNSTIVAKEDTADVIREELLSRDVEHDDEENDMRQSKELKLHKQHNKVILSSSEESDNDTVMSPSVTTHTDDVCMVFTTTLHDKLYPCHNEQPEVKWLTRLPSSTTNAAVMYMSDHKQYSCVIHPAAPWQRCRILCKQSNSKVIDVSGSSPVLKDKADNEDYISKQSIRFRRKRTKDSEHPSSDSETEPLKIPADNPAANEQVAINPTGTRTSKRVRRAPIKLRQ